jgi:MFS transporter, DHA3 family, macrolide efflux protein
MPDSLLRPAPSHAMKEVDPVNPSAEVLTPAQDPLQNRKAANNMVLMLAGKLVSLFGTFIYNFAVGLYVLKVTGSGLSFATVLMLGTLPRVLIAPFAGALADRLNRKAIVVGMDFLSGLIVLGLYLVSGPYGLRLEFIYGTSVLLAAANTFFSVTLEASIPNLVDDKRLVRINSLSESIASMTAIGAPMIGGVVFALIDIRIFLLVNGLSFLLSGCTEIFLDFEFQKRGAVPARGGLLAEMGAGLAYLKGNSFLFSIAWYAVFLNLFGSMGLNVSAPYIVNTIIGFSSTQYGFIMGFLPGGIFAGSLLLSLLPEAQKKYPMIAASTGSFAFFISLLGLPTLSLLLGRPTQLSFWFYTSVLFLIGVSIAFINIPVYVLIQRHTPDEYRGRVFGLLQTAQLAIVPAGLMLAGFLLETWPGWVVPLVSGLGIFALFAVVSRSQEVRSS